MGSTKKFDQRLGKETLQKLPALPGVYRFFDEKNELIYIGKAKNLRRRISQYRNAKRRKAHAKMKKIVSEAVRLEHEICENELQALKLENELIQKHRPKWNIAGAFYFLYPMIGIRINSEGQLFFCYTTNPEEHPQFNFHGAFRSRQRTREGFFSLMELLRLIGHFIPKNHLLKEGLILSPKKYEYIYGFRQIPTEWSSKLGAFFKGEDFSAIEELSLLLLDKPSATAKSAETQDRLREIRSFWRHEIQKLKKARESQNHQSYPITQKERDQLFITVR
jgi:predicted GIY-YIG superfamily endonuclease